MTFWDKVIEFNKNLDYKWNLPEKFSVLNPYLDNPETIIVMQEFYKKYYNDNKKRKFIIWINPSRHWAGVTGVPFTDTKRLESVCGIKITSVKTHEVSSVFIYDLIEAFWWAKEFYSKFSFSFGNSQKYWERSKKCELLWWKRTFWGCKRFYDWKFKKTYFTLTWSWWSICFVKEKFRFYK